MLINDSYSPNYRIIKNFFTVEESVSIIEDANRGGEASWSIDFDTFYPKKQSVSENYWAAIKDWEGMSINLDMHEWDKTYNLDKEKYETILLSAKRQVEERFSVVVKKEQFTINRWRVGREQKPHIDYYIDSEDNDLESLKNAGLQGKFLEDFKKSFYKKNYSTIIYLNEDFEGGELFFPQYDNLTLKPEIGTMICFKGDSKHLHGVKKITSGIRYTISIFWEEIK